VSSADVGKAASIFSRHLLSPQPGPYHEILFVLNQSLHELLTICIERSTVLRAYTCFDHKKKLDPLGKVTDFAKQHGTSAKVGVSVFMQLPPHSLPRSSSHVQSCSGHLTRALYAGRLPCRQSHDREACFKCRVCNWVTLHPPTMIPLWHALVEPARSTVHRKYASRSSPG